MPAKSEKQLRLIWAIRRKYKNRSKTPKKWKWVWGEEWTHLEKESLILRFGEFINENLFLAITFTRIIVRSLITIYS